MRIWHMALCCLPLMLTGCISSNDKPAMPSGIAGSVVHLPDDESLAQALARFAQAGFTRARKDRRRKTHLPPTSRPWSPIR